MAASAILLPFARAISFRVSQETHGFAVGQIVRKDTATSEYILAQADTLVHSLMVGMVSSVEDADTFVLTVSGLVTTLSGLDQGVLYYLDPDNDGDFTDILPTTLGDFVQPVMVALSATTALIFYTRGVQVGSLDAEFLTLALTAGLPNERVFTPGGMLQATDGGAGAAYTLFGSQVVNAQTLAYTAIASDRGKVIHYTGAGGVTLALTAAATLTNGWFTTLRNDSAGTITIDPAGAETINGAATLAVTAGGSVIIYTDGLLFYTVGSASPLAIPVTVPNGGTGVVTLTTAYGTLCAGTTATGPVQTVSPGSAGAPLVSGGAASLPSYTTLTVPGGGLGVTTLTTAYGTLCAGTTATGAVQTVSPGTATHVLTSNGAAATPTFQAPSAAASGLVPLGHVTAANVATVDFANLLTSTYKAYLLVGEGITVATDATFPFLRYGTGAGPTYMAGASDYSWASVGGGTGVTSDTADSEIDMAAGISEVGNAAGETCSFHTFVSNPANASIMKTCRFQMTPINNAGVIDLMCVGGGASTFTTAVTSLRFLMSSGNTLTGEFTLYGLASS